MNKKRKLNIVDLLIIVVIAAVAIIAVYKFGVVNQVRSTGLANEEKKMQYTALIKGVRQPTLEALHIGDKMYDDKTNVYIGEIVKIDFKPQKLMELGLDGNFVEVEKIDYFDVTMIIEAPILEKDNAYFVSGKVELKINSEFPVYTKFAKPNIQIISIAL